MIAFRVDANDKIGFGHIMRCLSIAKECSKQGQEILFITADTCPMTLIEKAGFSHIILDTAYNQMENEVDTLLEMILTLKIDCLIVDSYFVTQNYLEQIRKTTNVAYIDDLAKESFSVDILINYNLFADYVFYEKLYQNYQTKLLINTKYVPLREEFSYMKPISIKDQISNIFITTGGTDPFSLSSLLIERLLEDQFFNNRNIHIIVGQYFTNKTKLREQAMKSKQINLYENTMNIAKVMKQCDVAVSAGGSTLYELCACGMPTIAFSFADNQTLIRESFCKQEIMLDGKDIRYQKDYGVHLIIAQLKELDCLEKRAALQEKANTVTDGKGACRLATELIDFIYKKGDSYENQ